MKTNKMIIAVATFLTALFVEIIGCAVWLAPVSGIILYPFISGFALILSLVSFFFAKESKPLRIATIVLSIVLLISIIGDMGIMTSLMIKMF